MLINPIIYRRATRAIDATAGRSQVRVAHIELPLNLSTFPPFQFTTAERNINATLKWKFLMINFVFYVCWLPNLVCGIILWTSWHQLPEKPLIAIWYVMAILNPLQAFFNTLVYRKWTVPQHQQAVLYSFRPPDQPRGERTPLLQYPQLKSSNKPSAPPAPSYNL